MDYSNVGAGAPKSSDRNVADQTGEGDQVSAIHGKRTGQDVKYGKFRDAGIAQLVEQRIRNAWVGGSIPLSGTIFGLLRPSIAALDFAASRSRTRLYCSRHRRTFRLAVDVLATPKTHQKTWISGCCGGAFCGSDRRGQKMGSLLPITIPPAQWRGFILGLLEELDCFSSFTESNQSKQCSPE